MCTLSLHHMSSFSLNCLPFRNGVFTCMWFTVRTNPNQSTLSLSTLRISLRWVYFYTTVSFTGTLWELFTLNIIYLCGHLTESPAAVGSQAAAQRSAHQTRSEDHEVSATAEGLMFNMTCMHGTPTTRYKKVFPGTLRNLTWWQSIHFVLFCSHYNNGSLQRQVAFPALGFIIRALFTFLKITKTLNKLSDPRTSWSTTAKQDGMLRSWR